MTPSVVVIGVGNRARRDDAAGPLVVHEIARRRPDLRTVERDGDLSLLALDWERGDHVVVIDALADADGASGVTLVELDLEDVPRGRSVSSHGLGVVDAIRLAAAMGRVPGDLRLLGITGRDFAIGPPSPDLVCAAPVLADEVLSIIENMRLER